MTTGASPKAMDPERLADVKQFSAAAAVADSAPWVIEATVLRTRALLALTPTELDELIDDRDHWEGAAREAGGLLAEGVRLVAHYRDRCPVTAEDVDGDITAKARAWAFASGFKRPSWWRPDYEKRLGEEHDDWFVAEVSTDEGVMACEATPQQRVADLANWATAYVDACPLDILDEMAAQEAP